MAANLDFRKGPALDGNRFVRRLGTSKALQSPPSRPAARTFRTAGAFEAIKCLVVGAIPMRDTIVQFHPF